jgi:hypothetical protein
MPIDLSGSLMAGWVGKCSKLLERVSDAIRDHVFEAQAILGMDNSHGRFNVFEREVVLIWVTLLGLRAVERPLEVCQQLLKANDTIFLAPDDPNEDPLPRGVGQPD